jgi:acetyltransferase-like isoleucine patch superfamily enzyme
MVEEGETMISKTAVVESTDIGSGTKIGDFAVVGPGVRLGDGVIVHPHVVIEPGVMIGDGVEVFPGAYIGKEPKGAGATARKPEFQRGVVIKANCSVGSNAVIYQDVRIGENTLIGDGAVIREQGVVGARCIVGMHVTVGYSVTIQNGVKIMDHTHVVGKSLLEDGVFVAMNVGMANDRFIGRRGYEEEQIQGATIRKGAMVGVGANLLPGIEIGENAVVAAGAVVTRDVSASETVAGVPARTVRSSE